MRRGATPVRFIPLFAAVALLIWALTWCSGEVASDTTGDVSAVQRAARERRDHRAQLREYEKKLERIEASMFWYDRVIIEAYDNGSIVDISDDAIRVGPQFFTFSRKEQNIVVFAVWERDQSWAYPADDFDNFATNTLYKFDIIDDSSGEVVMVWTHTGEIGELSTP